VEEIKAKIIDEAFEKAGELETKTYNDMEKILDKLALIVDKLDCTVQTTADDIIQLIQNILYEPFPDPVEYCRGELAKEYGIYFRFTFISQMSLVQMYKLRKCRSLQLIDQHSAVSAVCSAYLDVETFAYKGRCASVAITPPGVTSDMVTYFLKEAMSASQVYSIYKCSSRNNPDQLVKSH